MVKASKCFPSNYRKVKLHPALVSDLGGKLPKKADPLSSYFFCFSNNEYQLFFEQYVEKAADAKKQAFCKAHFYYLLPMYVFSKDRKLLEVAYFDDKIWGLKKARIKKEGTMGCDGIYYYRATASSHEPTLTFLPILFYNGIVVSDKVAKDDPTLTSFLKTYQSSLTKEDVDSIKNLFGTGEYRLVDLR